jgi:hypothetical protein
MVNGINITLSKDGQQPMKSKWNKRSLQEEVPTKFRKQDADFASYLAKVITVVKQHTLTGIQLLSSGANFLPFALLLSTYLRVKYLKRSQGRETNFLIETIDGPIDSRTEATQQ